MAINLARLQPTQLAATSGRRVRVPVKPEVTAELDYNTKMAELEAKKQADLAAMEAETAAAKEKIASGQALALSEMDALAPKKSAGASAVAPQAAGVRLSDIQPHEPPAKPLDPSGENSGNEPEGPPMSMTATGVVSGQEMGRGLLGLALANNPISLATSVMGWIQMTQKAQKAMDLHKGTISSMSDPGAKGKKASHEATASPGAAPAAGTAGPTAGVGVNPGTQGGGSSAGFGSAATPGNIGGGGHSAGGGAGAVSGAGGGGK